MITHILLIFIAASESDSPTSEALLRALTDALGPTSKVTIRGVRSPPNDEMMVEEVQGAEATAAVRLVWDDPGRVVLHVYVAKGDETFDQRLSFQPSDPPEERGRALGFVIASYLLPPVRRAPPATVAARPPAEARWALEGFGIAAVVPQGAGGGFGGAFGVRWWAGERWGFRAGVLVRSGSVPSADATSLGAGASLGIFRVLLAGSRLSLVGRAEAMMLYDSLTHKSDHDPPQDPMTESGLLPGVAAFAELEWRLAAATAIHLGLGVETAFGTHEILVAGVTQASIGALRGVAELGLRARF